MADSEPQWLLLTASLPGQEASAARVRLWRALKDLGVGSLRDGVSLAPASDAMRGRLEDIRGSVQEAGGSAWLLEIQAQRAPVERALRALFDRADAYAEFLPAVAALRQQLRSLDEAATRQRLRELEAELDSIAALDFFPAAPQARARAALEKLQARVNLRFSPAEPTSATGPVRSRRIGEYRGQRWATRRRMWVDRVASAWLIRHFIDHDATFVWLSRPADCPKDAHGFDFDGAEFTHVGNKVTFEVLLASFGLDADPALASIAAAVHFLDVGGIPVPDARGLETMLKGSREKARSDDALLADSIRTFDLVYSAYRAP
jgi:hypothetical protein